MQPSNSHSVLEVLKLSLADIQDPNFSNHLNIEDWSSLPSPVREQCISRLNALMEEEEMAKSTAVGAAELIAKLSQIERSRSVTPVATVWDPLDPDRTKDDWQKEVESHEALIKDGGLPCYPIDLGFDVLDDQGPYKDIIQYWRRETVSNQRLIFTSQLSDWVFFRHRQERHRRHSKRRFLKLEGKQLELRRRYGLGGHVRFLERVVDQSRLEDWMEYQHYKLCDYEKMETRLKITQARLASNRKMLTEEGYSSLGEIEVLTFAEFNTLSSEWIGNLSNVKKQQEFAERRLAIANIRSASSQAQDLGEIIERDRWVDRFEERATSQRRKVQALKRRAARAQSALDQSRRWFSARWKTWASNGWDDWSVRGNHMIERDTNSKVYCTKVRESERLTIRAKRASHAELEAAHELELAEEVLKVAQMEDLAPAIERAALIRRIQKEKRFAEYDLEERIELVRILDLKMSVVSDLKDAGSILEDMKRLKILLDWIEVQRLQLVNDSTGLGSGSIRRRSGRLKAKQALSELFFTQSTECEGNDGAIIALNDSGRREERRSS